ncbi:MAG: PbsX family transcriptional regulator [Alphaproteobacteria bacterium]|nr:PbsX family transcriptional regulator [Alphaproteobacteria bacterium]
MRVTVKRRGSGTVVSIPAAVLATVQIRAGDLVDVRAEDGKIIIERIADADYDLDQLLGGMPDSLHGAVDFGRSVGQGSPISSEAMRSSHWT